MLEGQHQDLEFLDGDEAAGSVKLEDCVVAGSVWTDRLTRSSLIRDVGSVSAAAFTKTMT
jgi:hypothetical protein